MSRSGLSAGSFRTQMMGLWSNVTGQAVDNFNRILDIINAASFRIFSGKIGTIREAGSSLLSSALDERGAMIDEAAAEVQRLLGGQGELATAGGPSARRAPRPDAPDLDAQVMRMEGAGGGRLIGGRYQIPDASELRRSGTVEAHRHDMIRNGTSAGRRARPYIDSPSLINEIMSAVDLVPDPQGVPGAFQWLVPGSFRGSEGNWELVVNLETNTIIHFLFKQ